MSPATRSLLPLLLLAPGCVEPPGGATDAGSLDRALADAPVVDGERVEVGADAARDAPTDAPAPPATPWVRALDASFLVTPAAVAVSPEGVVCVVGDFQGDLRVGGRRVSSSGASDGFVACFDADGAPRLLVTTGVQGDDGLTAAAWDQGELVVAGHFPRPAALGGAPLAHAGGVDVLVARVDLAGRFTRAVSFGGAGDDQPSALAVDPLGVVHVAGASDQNLRVGALALTADGRSHAWIVGLDRAFAPVRGRSFAAGFDAQISALRVGGDGAVTLGGHFSGSLTTGGPALGPTLAQDVFVLRLSPEGHTLWAQRYGGGGDDRLHDLAVDGAGEVLLAGSSGIGRVSVGAEGFDVQGPSDGWVARLDAVGLPRWLRRVGGDGNDRALSVFVDEGGGEVAGRFERGLTLGATSLTSQGESDGWRARFDDGGGFGASEQYGGTGPDAVARVVEAPRGSVTIGTFAARAEVGGETLQTAGISGAFVHRAVRAVTP